MLRGGRQAGAAAHPLLNDLLLLICQGGRLQSLEQVIHPARQEQLRLACMEHVHGPRTQPRMQLQRHALAELSPLELARLPWADSATGAGRKRAQLPRTLLTKCTPPQCVHKRSQSASDTA